MWSAFVFSTRNLYWEMNESVIKVNFSMFNSFSNSWTSWHGLPLGKLIYEPFVKVNCKQSMIIFCSTYFAQTRNVNRLYMKFIPEYIMSFHGWIYDQKLTFWDNLPLYSHSVYQVQNIITGLILQKPSIDIHITAILGAFCDVQDSVCWCKYALYAGHNKEPVFHRLNIYNYF